MGSTPTEEPPAGVKYCKREGVFATRIASLWKRP